MSNNSHRNQYNTSEVFQPFMDHQVDDSYYRQEMRKLLPQNLSGLKILDIGCGTGHDLAFFVERGAEAYGIDAAMKMVQYASKKVSAAKVIQHDFTKQFPFESSYFDLVHSQFALEHEFDLTKIFEEVHRVLAPNGVFFLLVMHPIKHLLEKTNHSYFEQEQYVEIFFDGTASVQMTSHCLADYLSPYVLSHFRLTKFAEKSFEPGNCVKEWGYPSYMILRLAKNNL